MLIDGEEVLCFDCLSSDVTSSVEPHRFMYGSGVDSVLLTTSFLVFTCQKCGFQFSGQDGEQAMDWAVLDYLESKNKIRK